MRTLLGLTLFAAVSAAQVQPGDIVGADRDMFRIDAGGNLTTFARLPTRAVGLGLGVANRGFIVEQPFASMAFTLEVANDGTVTTLRPTWPSARWIDVDGEGNYLAAGFSPGMNEVVFTLSASGAARTILRGFANANSLWGMGVDTLTGDAIARQIDIVRNASFLRITRGPAPIVTTITAPLFFPGPTGIHARFDQPGAFLSAAGGAIHSIDPRASPVITTLRTVFSRLRQFTDIEYEPRTGQYLIVQGANLQSTIYRFDPSNASFTSVIPTPGHQTFHIAVAGTRHLAALNAPRVGQAFRMRASFPGQAGAPFVTALSFGMAPGISIRGGTVYLATDALFRLSLSNAGIFSGFQGTLDATGEAPPTLAIPPIPGLAGIRFFGAAVALPTSGPPQISEPVGFTVR